MRRQRDGCTLAMQRRHTNVSTNETDANPCRRQPLFVVLVPPARIHALPIQRMGTWTRPRFPSRPWQRLPGQPSLIHNALSRNTPTKVNIIRNTMANMICPLVHHSKPYGVSVSWVSVSLVGGSDGGDQSQYGNVGSS